MTEIVDPIARLAREIGAKVQARELDLDDLRKRLEAARATFLPGSNTQPVAVLVDGDGPYYGLFRWRDAVDDGTNWQIDTEVYLHPLGSVSELRWGDVDSQPFSGSAYAKETRAELNEPVRTLFKGLTQITREEC